MKYSTQNNLLAGLFVFLAVAIVAWLVVFLKHYEPVPKPVLPVVPAVPNYPCPSNGKCA